MRACAQAHTRALALRQLLHSPAAPCSFLQGCGLVTMGSHEEAVNAIDHLDSKFVWEGMESPMVVKWMDAALQRRRREQHLAAMRQGLVPNMTMGECDGVGVIQDG